MHALIFIIFGSPGVALFDTIKSSGLTMTDLDIPSSIMNSFVELINRELLAVASEIFTHGIPDVAINFCIGRGEAPLCISTISPNLHSFHSSIPSPSHILNRQRNNFIAQIQRIIALANNAALTNRNSGDFRQDRKMFCHVYCRAG